MRASRANAAFWLAWLCVVVWCYFNNYDDPSSIFYDRAKAYRQRFSTVRTAEVDRFLAQTSFAAPASRSEQPLLCVGIPSINRTTESFLEHTVGSLIDTLTPKERELVYVVVLLADRPRRATPRAALGNATNYHATPYEVRGEPRGDGRVENMRLDHSVLVERCHAKKTPYFALVEDDVVASRDWFRRFRDAIPYVESEAQKTGQDWIYTRLFYSELFMGWNAEEWLTYAEVVFGVYAVLLLVFLELRRRHKIGPSGPSAKGTTREFNFMAALVFCLWMPALIALFFMAGRISLHRLNPFTGRGSLLRNPPFAFAGDQILEDYARDHGLMKWALDPSVLQHTGRRESSDGPRKADVWNFSFERQQR
ncbi:hypothetical protein ACCO45_003881 [Purpureocillium lilacinum]|uniref:Uncharacterized protein n=1 Tax=Purpureocillium lilacinum TaxID=33203 RepID=A0ACC4E2A7_PURLI